MFEYVKNEVCDLLRKEGLYTKKAHFILSKKE